jgi:hypothetical protein
VNSIDTSKSIIALSLTSKRWQAHLHSFFKPKLAHALPFSHDKYTSISKRIEVCRGVTAAQDVAPGLQLFEYEPNYPPGYEIHKQSSLTVKFLPWNCTYFISIPLEEIYSTLDRYLCVHSLEQPSPIYTSKLLSPGGDVETGVRLEAIAFNSQRK